MKITIEPITWLRTISELERKDRGYNYVPKAFKLYVDRDEYIVTSEEDLFNQIRKLLAR